MDAGAWHPQPPTGHPHCSFDFELLSIAIWDGRRHGGRNMLEHAVRHAPIAHFIYINIILFNAKAQIIWLISTNRSGEAGSVRSPRIAGLIARSQFNY